LCAPQQTWVFDFRSGSSADIEARQSDVRFTPEKRTLICTTLMSAYPQKGAKRIERSALCHNLCIELRRSSRQCGYEGWEKMRNLPGLTAWIAGAILCLVSVHVQHRQYSSIQ
jgi:hypothetical protein